MRPPILTSIGLMLLAIVLAYVAGVGPGNYGFAAAIGSAAFGMASLTVVGADAYAQGVEDGRADAGEDEHGDDPREHEQRTKL